MEVSAPPVDGCGDADAEADPGRPRWPVTVKVELPAGRAAEEKAFWTWLAEDLRGLLGTARDRKVVGRRIQRELSSFPLALAELAVLAGLAAVGTALEQGEAGSFYGAKYGPMGRAAIGILGFDHMYTSWPFLGMAAVLAASLAACTNTRQLPAVKIARRWRFKTGPRILQLPQSAARAGGLDTRGLGRRLEGSGYQVFVEGDQLYAFKGLAGKLAPIGVHLSMLLIMAGATLSGVGGWKGSAMVPEGGQIEIREGLRPQSFLARPPEVGAYKLFVNDFAIDYYPDGKVEQFRSDLAVVDPAGALVTRKEISVNDPLRVGGVTMYQTDWEVSGVQVAVSGLGDLEGAELALPMASLEGKLDNVGGRLWGAFLPTDVADERVRGISLVARDLQSVVVYDSAGKFVGVRRPDSGKPISVEGVDLVVRDITGSTGLELKADPGVPYVYVGMGVLMVTTALSYLSFTEFWALTDGGKLYAGGRTNRAKKEFKREFSELVRWQDPRAGAILK